MVSPPHPESDHSRLRRWGRAVLRTLFPNRYAVFLAGLFVYFGLTDSIVEFTKGVWRMEVPLLLYAYYTLNAWARPSRWQAWIAAVPLLLLYLAHDYYYLRFFRVLKLVEVTQIPELLGVAGLVINTGLGLGMLGVLYLLATRFRVTLVGAIRAIPLALIFAGPFVHPTFFIQLYSALSMEVIHYAALINVEYNGRLASALYSEAKRREMIANISHYRDIEQLSMRLPPGMTANGRNVHLIIMESFVDPTLFSQLPQSVQAAHPDYPSLVQKARGLSISPVFGGYTSQAEFEFLCGVPAFQEFDEIEFNSFTGAETYCLPNILKGMGYASLASNGYKPDFFNTIPAYKGIGFDAAFFPKQYTPTSPTYIDKGDYPDNKYLFDGDLLDQNLAFVKGKLGEGKPFLNYVLTVYGHFPFDLGSRTGPRVFTVPDVPKDVESVLNQHYYRTQALTRYLKGLMALDPEALIVVVSDHLPPLQYGTKAYDTLGYLPEHPDKLHANRMLVFRGGRPEAHPQFTHFNIYRLILDFVTDGAYCKVQPCRFDQPVDKETLREDYHIIMGLATR